MNIEELAERARQAFADGAKEVADETERMLEAGATTDAIAEAFGIQYKGLAARLRRNGYGVVLARLSRRRINEATQRIGRTVANGKYPA